MPTVEELELAYAKAMFGSNKPSFAMIYCNECATGFFIPSMELCDHLKAKLNA